MIRNIYLYAFIALVFFYGVSSSADTLYLKNGEAVKGLILNEYKDRVVISTMNGEEVFQKTAIKGATYDEKIRESIQKARNEVKRKDYISAYYTYSDVLRMDPGCDEAKERIDFLSKFLYTSPNRQIKKDIERRNMESAALDGTDILEEASLKMGFYLVPGEKYVTVGSPRKTGQKIFPKGIVSEGDEIVAVWGEMAAYMDVRDVSGIIAGPYESSVVLQRHVEVLLSREKGLFSWFPGRYKNVIGGVLHLEDRGVVVKEVVPGGPFDGAGIEQGDVIVMIDRKDISYMPIRSVISMIEKKGGEYMVFSMRRRINIWETNSK